MIAGLDGAIHDRIRARSAKIFAPNGRLLAKPIGRAGYTSAHARAYLAEADEYVRTLEEKEPIELLMLVVDRGDATTDFCREFFPFALIRLVPQFAANDARNGNEFNRLANAYVATLETHGKGLRKAAAGVREVTTLHNTSPVLLPLRNFRSKRYHQTLEAVFATAGQQDNPRALLKAAIDQILADHPRAKVGTEKRSYYSDGVTLFHSPGSARHAFFRPKKDEQHSIVCLLSARTRFGGSYDPNFHFDCMAAKGALAKRYPNCHDAPTPPASSDYVNIAPNDFVR